MRRNDPQPGARRTDDTGCAHMSRDDLIREIERLRRRLDDAGEIHRLMNEIDNRREDSVVQREQLVEAQAALEESRDRYADLYDFAPLGYITLSGAGGMVEDANQTAAAMIGIERASIIGNPFRIYIAEPDRRLFLDHLRRCRERGGVTVTELRLNCRTGRPIPVQLSSRPMPRVLSSGQCSYRTAITDISDLKRAEARLRELNETLEQRVARRTEQLRKLSAELGQAEQRERRRIAQILHDHLQQLLVAARMGASALRTRLDDPDLLAAVEQIDSLLNDSIQEARSLATELSPPILYDGGLGPAVEWLARQMKQHYGLHVDVQCDIPPLVIAEDVRALLFHATRELLFNVVKHARADRAAVHITAEAQHTALVLVEDPGSGFEPDALEDHRESAGLGLLGIRERLEWLGGELRIDSAPGRGTRMILRAPIRTPATAAADPAGFAGFAGFGPPAPAPSARAKRGGPTRVLLADDHKVLREGLATLLASQPDIEIVAQADNGIMAIDLARRTRPDVVVMDVSMPEMCGVEATRRLVADLPGTRVIGLSMHQKEDMAHAMRAAGAADYLIKDGPAEALLASIRKRPPA